MTHDAAPPQLSDLARNTAFSLRRCYVDLFYAHEVRQLPSGSRVLDLGGVRTVARPGMFDVSRFPLDVVCVNILPSANPNVIAAGEALPFAGRTFDAVICSEVLEHVRDPRLVLAEIERVLVPGGIALIAVPFLYQIHASPHDFGRYTDDFWKSVLQDSGLPCERIEKQGLYWSVMLDFVRLPIERASAKTTRALWRKFLRAVMLWPMAWLRVWAVKAEAKPSLRAHPTYANFTTGFGIVARKPLATS